MRLREDNDPSKPARMRIEAELSNEAHFKDKVLEEKYISQIEPESDDHWTFFYGDATVMRSSKDPSVNNPVELEIRNDAPPDSEPIVFASGRNNNLTQGLYIRTDGKIFIKRPGHGWKVEVISHGNPYDVGLNWRC